MKAAVLCPGPSLPKEFDRTGYDHVIAVNRAALSTDADYIILPDDYTLGWLTANALRRRPVIVSSLHKYRQMIDSLWIALHSPFLERDIHWLEVPGYQWWTKSLTTALVLAAWMGADEIECVGVDWKGTKDFDGFTDSSQQRTDERWTKERLMARAVVAKLAEQGVTVKGLPK